MSTFSPSFFPQPRVYPQPSGLCRPFVFIVLQIPFPATRFLSHPYKMPGCGIRRSSWRTPEGVTLQRILERLISVLSVPQWQIQSLSPSPAKQKTAAKRRDLHNFGAVITTFRINTCESVSKQTTLTSFRINTCEKHREGRGVPLT